MGFKTFAAAGFAAIVLAGGAGAATLGSLFDVTAVNVVMLDRAESRATRGNFDAALAGTLGNAQGNPQDSFTYDGALDFGTFDGTDATTIEDFLRTGGGTLAGLDQSFGMLQNSKPNISNGGTATTTFYRFSASFSEAMDFTIRHDDGISVFDDGVLLGGFSNPTSVRTTNVNGFDGGFLELFYVSTNGDPSVLSVDFAPAPIPVPAALPLLMSAFGGLYVLRRRRDAAKA